MGLEYFTPITGFFGGGLIGKSINEMKCEDKHQEF